MRVAGIDLFKSKPQSLIFSSPVEEVYKLEAELVVDVFLGHLRVHLRGHHESQEELVHQLYGVSSSRRRKSRTNADDFGWHISKHKGTENTDLQFAQNALPQRDVANCAVKRKRFCKQDEMRQDEMRLSFCVYSL